VGSDEVLGGNGLTLKSAPGKYRSPTSGCLAMVFPNKSTIASLLGCGERIAGIAAAQLTGASTRECNGFMKLIRVKSKVGR
jgi:hypothetical protein